MRGALDVYRLREGARLLAERCARSPGSARVCAREIRTSKDVINLAPQQNVSEKKIGGVGGCSFNSANEVVEVGQRTGRQPP